MCEGKGEGCNVDSNRRWDNEEGGRGGSNYGKVEKGTIIPSQKLVKGGTVAYIILLEMKRQRKGIVAEGGNANKARGAGKACGEMSRR